MVETPGLCRNGSACRVATLGQIVTIPLGHAFVCPGCGHALVPPTQHTPAPVRSRSPVLPLALGCGALLLAGGAVLAGRSLALSAHNPAAQAGVIASTAGTRAAPPAQPASPASAASLSPAPRPLAEPSALPAADPRPAPVSTAITAMNLPASHAVPTAPPPTAAAMAAQPTPPAPPQPMPAAVQSPTIPTPQDQPPEVADPPFDPVPLAGGAPAYPASLAADGRAGRVLIGCQIMADGRPQGCRASPARGGAAFPTAVLAWLNHGQVRYRPLTLHGRPVPGFRIWQITLEEPAAVLADARRKALAAQQAEAEAEQAASPEPAPAATPATQPQTAAIMATRQPDIQPVAARLPAMPSLADRPFSTRVLQGGQPEYPAIYGETRPGSVTVRCNIETDGTPTGCEVVQQQGGSAFSQSVQNWLRSGGVRFAPIVAGGQPVARVQTWTVTFRPPA